MSSNDHQKSKYRINSLWEFAAYLFLDVTKSPFKIQDKIIALFPFLLGVEETLMSFVVSSVRILKKCIRFYAPGRPIYTHFTNEGQFSPDTLK